MENSAAHPQLPELVQKNMMIDSINVRRQKEHGWMHSSHVAPTKVHLRLQSMLQSSHSSA